MHYLPYPRRRYRALFFPPGLLALAGLLWLGCRAVVRIVPPTMAQAVIEVATTALHPNAEIRRLSPIIHARPQELEQFRPWYSTMFVGNVFSDYFTLQTTRIVAQQMWGHSGQNTGLRVQFSETAVYSNLIEILDCFKRVNATMFWLDVKHRPITIYSFTPVPKKEKLTNADRPTPLFICGNTSTFPYIPSRPEVPRVEPPAILSPIWRNTWLLLLFLAGLSIRQLMRLRAAYCY